MQFIKIFSFTLILFLIYCKSKYESMLERESARHIRKDSLFLDLYLGMPSKEFFARCWEMNKQHVLMMGPGNLSARYMIDSLMRFPTYMDFYPTFNGDSISEMPMKFTYRDWGPWNKTYACDSLLSDVAQLAHQWYGDGFIKVSKKKKGDIFVKVEGNRQVKFYKTEPNEVHMIITDLSHPPKPIE